MKSVAKCKSVKQHKPHVKHGAKYINKESPPNQGAKLSPNGLLRSVIIEANRQKSSFDQKWRF
jgi:hypothetical protein